MKNLHHSIRRNIYKFAQRRVNDWDDERY